MTGDELIAQYRALAKSGIAFRGMTVLQHSGDILKMVRRYRAQTILDYGCGAGDAYLQPHVLHKLIGVRRHRVRLYDPAFPEHSRPPKGRFDGVICSDVLEHIPEADVPAFIERLFSHARLFVWASVCCRPAKKAFADGTNMHVTVRPIDWWQAQMSAACPDGVAYALTETA